MAEWLSSILEYVFDFSGVLNASISASWLILVVILLRIVLKKTPKWTHVALWGIVALRLLMPFSIESAFSLIPSTQTVSDQLLQAGPVPGGEPAYLEIVTNPSYGSTVTIELDQNISSFQWDMMLMAIPWMVGMALMALHTAVSYWRLRKKVDTAVILRYNIFQSEYVGSPFVLGIIKPRIYLPYSMEKRNMEHVIAHEQAHIRRKDHWWKPLGFFLLTIHWFNPIMWVAYILLCRDIELACDEKVIADLGNNQRADYTQALVACSVNRRMIAACPLAFGEVGVKERVKSIMNYRKPTFWIIVTAIVICAVVAVCFLTNPTPSPEFSMSGNNISDLDSEAIVERILKIENCESSNIYMNSDNFSLIVDSDFNWVDSQTVRYFFGDYQKTYSAQLRIFPEEGKYFITESSEWLEQERIFLLRHYLDAIKYLPQDVIQQMAPADQYIIRQIEEGNPRSYSQEITYTSNGAEEIDGWLIHLEIQPLIEVDGAFNGSGDEIIHVFYGDDVISGVIPESKVFADSKDDIIGTISSVKNMESITTQNGDILLLQNEGGMWHFEEGQQVDVSIIFDNDGSSLSMKSIGYIYCGDGSEGIYTNEIFSDQNVSRSNGSFIVPETGNYLFYFRNYSASWIKLNSFTVEYGSHLQAKVLEIHDGYFLVEPVEGSWELLCSDRFVVSMTNMAPSPEPQVGDILEITYNGAIEESYPAILGYAYSIRVVGEKDTSEVDKIDILHSTDGG